VGLSSARYLLLTARQDEGAAAALGLYGNEAAKSLERRHKQIEGPLYEKAGESTTKNRTSHTFILSDFLPIGRIDIEIGAGMTFDGI
jgi:hypothetical protein